MKTGCEGGRRRSRMGSGMLFFILSVKRGLSLRLHSLGSLEGFPRQDIHHPQMVHSTWMTLLHPCRPHSLLHNRSNAPYPVSDVDNRVQYVRLFRNTLLYTYPLISPSPYIYHFSRRRRRLLAHSIVFLFTLSGILLLKFGPFDTVITCSWIELML